MLNFRPLGAELVEKMILKKQDNGQGSYKCTNVYPLCTRTETCTLNLLLKGLSKGDALEKKPRYLVVVFKVVTAVAD